MEHSSVCSRGAAGVMDHFDEVVVDREVRLADVQAYLDAPDGGRLYLDRYQVSAVRSARQRQETRP
jgi:hypothetical protein